jgi:trehalose-phosphatase
MGSEFDTTLGQYVEMCSKLGIIIDFDGTLSPLAKTPDLAIIPPETKKVLERLANMADVHVVIISGRELDDLRQKVLLQGCVIVALQGCVIVAL